MARRFRLQDLQAPGQRQTARPVDGFVRLTQAAPQDPQLDLSQLGAGVASHLQRKEADDRARQEEAGEQFARNESDKLQAVQEAIESATEGLTDPGEIADAQSSALRKLTESGIVPPQANPRWLVGAARAETQRQLAELSRRLEGRLPEFGAVSDASGDLAEAPDVEATIQDEFDAVLESPLVRNSRTARALVDDFRAQFEPEYLGSVSQRRMQDQALRAEALHSDQLVQGFQAGGTQFVGIAALGDVETDPELALDSIKQAVDYLRNEEGVPRTDELLRGAIAGWVANNAEDNPAAAKRALNRLSNLELVDGLPLERDKRFTKTIASLRDNVESQELRELQLAESTQRTIRQSATSIFRGVFGSIMEANPGASLEELKDAAFSALEENESYLELLDAADLNELPEEVRGDLLVQAREDASTGIRQRATLDAQHEAQIQLSVRDGLPAEDADKLAAELLSPAAYLAWTKDNTSSVWSQVVQSPSFRRVQAQTRVMPEGLSGERQVELNGLLVAAEERLADLAVEASRRGEDPTSALRTPEAAEILRRVEAAKERASEPLRAAQDAFALARERGDVGAMDEQLQVLRGSADPETYRAALIERERKGKEIDNTLVQDQVYRQTLSSLTSSLSVLAEQQGLGETEARALADDLLIEFQTTSRRREREEVAPLPTDAQRAARAQVVAEARQAALDRVLSDEQQSVIRQAEESGASEAARRAQAEYDFRDFDQTGSLQGVLDVPIPREVESPARTIRFLETDSTDRRLERSAGAAGLSLVRALDASPAAVSDQVLEAHVPVLGMAGAFSVDDVLEGRASVELQPDGRDTQAVVPVGLGQTQDFRGVTISRGSWSDPTTLRADVEIEDLHPTLTLLFKRPTEVDAWLDRPEADRKALYGKLGLPTDDLAATDRDFVRRQKILLVRYMP